MRSRSADQLASRSATRCCASARSAAPGSAVAFFSCSTTTRRRSSAIGAPPPGGAKASRRARAPSAAGSPRPGRPTPPGSGCGDRREPGRARPRCRPGAGRAFACVRGSPRHHRRLRSAAARITMATLSSRSAVSSGPSMDGSPVPRRRIPQNLRRQSSLRQAGHEREQRAEDRRLGQPLSRDEVRGQHRECAPGEAEPRIAVEGAAEELEVVGDDEEAARRDEEEQPGRPGQGGGDADRNGAADRHSGKRDQDAGRDPGAQRTPVQLVERMRPDSEREEKRGQRGQQPPACELGGQRRADRNVRGARRCRGSEAASRSRASRRTRARRTRDGLRASPPEHEATAEREPPGWTSSMPALRHRPEGRDARETRGCSARGTIPPAASPARRSPRAPAVRCGRRAPTPAGQGPAAGRTRASRSSRRAARRGRAPHRRARIGHVAEQVGEGERVEAASSNGSRSAVPSTSSIRSSSPAVATRRRPVSSISGLWSSPTTRQPVRRASSIATAAVPVATSSTVSSGPTGTRETRNRRQRGSWPKESNRAYRS